MKEYKLIRCVNGGCPYCCNEFYNDYDEIYSALIRLIDTYHNDFHKSVSCVFYDYLCDDFNADVKLWVEERDVTEFKVCYNVKNNKLLHLCNKSKKHIA